MSRESKIGLLVATAFILIVGLLLSDHVTVASRQPPAPLTATADGVVSGLTTPGNGGLSLPEPAPAEPFVYAPAPVAEPGQIDVRIGHAPQPSEPQPTPSMHAEPIWDNPKPTVAEPTVAEPTIETVAVEQGEPVEAVEVVKPAAPEPQVAVAVVTPDRPIGVVEVVAKPGDTLGHLAARAFGRSTSDNNAKIVALNPSLADDPNLIVAGRTYRLPAEAKDAAAVQVPVERNPAATAYTVRAGDNLWQIAAKQLGDGNRHREIVKLNPALSDPNALRVGMTLKLPS